MSGAGAVGVGGAAGVIAADAAVSGDSVKGRALSGDSVATPPRLPLVALGDASAAACEGDACLIPGASPAS